LTYAHSPRDVQQVPPSRGRFVVPGILRESGLGRPAEGVRENARSLGVDVEQISIGGASAGANLGAGAAVKLRDEDDWRPAQLILGYPVAHPVVPSPSASLAALVTEVPQILRFPPVTTKFINLTSSPV
jgi:hypothetical protein